MIGRDATSDALTEGMDVILFFGTGRDAIGSGTSAVYAFAKDSVIVPLGAAATPPAPTTEIVFLTQ